jgi:hypothetical protein
MLVLKACANGVDTYQSLSQFERFIKSGLYEFIPLIVTCYHSEVPGYFSDIVLPDGVQELR